MRPCRACRSMCLGTVMVPTSQQGPPKVFVPSRSSAPRRRRWTGRRGILSYLSADLGLFSRHDLSGEVWGRARIEASTPASVRAAPVPSGSLWRLVERDPDLHAAQQPRQAPAERKQTVVVPVQLQQVEGLEDGIAHGLDGGGSRTRRRRRHRKPPPSPARANDRACVALVGGCTGDSRRRWNRSRANASRRLMGSAVERTR
jgi:hypothetical protein